MTPLAGGLTRAALDLTREIEQFLYAEADLLDERRFLDWLDLLADDIHYAMPLARNLPFDQREAEYAQAPLDVAWFDEGKETLRQRVEQLLTAAHWAEEPLSRVSHLVTNVRLLAAEPSAEAAREVQVSSRFLVYRNRLQAEQDLFVGKRRDVLRRAGDTWQIVRRTIYLDQTVLLAKNLTTFF